MCAGVWIERAWTYIEFKISVAAVVAAVLTLLHKWQLPLSRKLLESVRDLAALCRDKTRGVLVASREHRQGKRKSEGREGEER